MRYWIDEKSGISVCKPDTCDEILSYIWMIGCDYDGCNTVESLKELIDELVEMAKEARECLHEEKLYASDLYGSERNCTNCANGPYECKEPCGECFDRSKWRQREQDV